MEQSSASGPYAALGRIVRQARLDRGMSRAQLVKVIMVHQTLDVTRTGASFMVRELEDDGIVMNTDVIKRITTILGVPYP